MWSSLQPLEINLRHKNINHQDQKSLSCATASILFFHHGEKIGGIIPAFAVRMQRSMVTCEVPYPCFTRHLNNNAAAFILFRIR